MGFFRNDVLAQKKSFHVCVDKDVYIKLRILAFQNCLRLPEVVQFFITQLVNDNYKAQKILEECLVAKMQKQIGGRKLRKKFSLPEKISEQDQSLLYNLIEGYDASHDEDVESTEDDTIPIDALYEAIDEDPKT
jgi:hypothetical protein